MRNWLLECFQHKIIALYHESEWPARSPDMKPCDYFLWGFLKNQVFSTPPHTIADLRQRIITEVDVVKRNRMLVRRSVRDMLRRAHLCIERGGGHVEGNHA